MKPTVFTLGGVALHAYGLAIAVGFALGVLVAAREARRRGLDPGAFVDLLFWILVAGVLGSRLAFVLLHVEDYIRLCRAGGVGACAAPLEIWEGGLVFYGGVLGAAGAVAVYARRHRWPFRVVADALAPGLALGHAVGRVGCFLAGCCYGRPSATLGVAFPPGSAAYDDLARLGLLAPGAAATPPLAPTQLYEAAGELVIFTVLMAFRRRQGFSGSIALGYAILYGLLRFTVELFRGDVQRGVFGGGLSVAQVVSVVLVVSAAAGWWRGARRRRP